MKDPRVQPKGSVTLRSFTKQHGAFKVNYRLNNDVVTSGLGRKWNAVFKIAASAQTAHLHVLFCIKIHWKKSNVTARTAKTIKSIFACIFSILRNKGRGIFALPRKKAGGSSGFRKPHPLHCFNWIQCGHRCCASSHFTRTCFMVLILCWLTKCQIYSASFSFFFFLKRGLKRGGCSVVVQ